jgi:hypothetical protein
MRTLLIDIYDSSMVNPCHLLGEVNGDDVLQVRRPRQDADAVDCVRAAFPAGSLTGAPEGGPTGGSNLRNRSNVRRATPVSPGLNRGLPTPRGVG